MFFNKDILKRSKPFIIAEDKVEEFLNEKTDEETINKIYEMADKFEKICNKTDF